MTDLRELLGDKHDDVIEKAARATWFGYLTYPDPCPEWDGLTEAQRRIHRSVVSSTLASVLPDLLADAERWDEGFDAGDRTARAVNDEWPERTHNPYRQATA